MLSASNTQTLPVPRHLWSSDSEIGKIRRSLFIFWIRSSILLWILILLIALIYLGSGVVSISFATRSRPRHRFSLESRLAHAISGCLRHELRQWLGRDLLRRRLSTESTWHNDTELDIPTVISRSVAARRTDQRWEILGVRLHQSRHDRSSQCYSTIHRSRRSIQFIVLARIGSHSRLRRRTKFQ